jgi:hypothetical protein
MLAVRWQRQKERMARQKEKPLPQYQAIPIT